MAWTQVANVEEIAVGEMKQVTIDDVDLAVYHLDDGFYVTSDVCTHASISLTGGTLNGEIVSCPRHGGKFNVKSGQATAFPCVIPLETYEVEVRDNKVFIDFE